MKNKIRLILCLVLSLSTIALEITLINMTSNPFRKCGNVEIPEGDGLEIISAGYHELPEAEVPDRLPLSPEDFFDTEHSVPEGEYCISEDYYEGPSVWDRLKDYILNTPEGGRYVLMGAAFLAYILFLVTWRKVARIDASRVIRLEKTVNGPVRDSPIKEENILPDILERYEEHLKSKYDYYGPQGDRAFLFWVYDRITERDEIALNFREEALRDLRTGSIRTLYDYDWYVRYYQKVALNRYEVRHIIDGLFTAKDTLRNMPKGVDPFEDCEIELLPQNPEDELKFI